MLKRRTDLAVEARDLSGTAGEIPGVESETALREGFRVETVKVLDRRGAEALGKPVGTYVTLFLEGVARREQGAFPRAVEALRGVLAPLLPLGEGDGALVVGLGNRAITPDAVGPKAADLTLVTRHLIAMAPEQFGAFRSVAALAAGVLGTTGVESGELVRAVVDKVRPKCVIAVDALASRKLDRVCTTVQVADTGITPGSGVGNARNALNLESLGVPVIAVGVPTVVDGATLCADVLEVAGKGVFDPAELSGGAGGGLMVTPRDIDERVSDMAKIIGYGLDLALQPGLGIEELELLIG